MNMFYISVFFKVYKGLSDLCGISDWTASSG